MQTPDLLSPKRTPTVNSSVVYWYKTGSMKYQHYLLTYETGDHVSSVDINGTDGHDFLSVSRA